jgi:DNA-binding NarL/FixJ family response regulator
MRMDNETPSVAANLVELRLHLLVLEGAVSGQPSGHLIQAVRLVDETLGLLRRAGTAEPSGLTAREQTLMPLLAEGLSNRQIADTLALSEATVKGYLRQLQRKLGTANRVQTALKARQMA